MNLLVGFVILLCLIASEVQTAEVTPELWQRIFLVGLISISVPGLAFFQTLIVSKRFRQQDLPELQRQTITQRLSICHSAVWLSASLATIIALRWQDVVRGNWDLDRYLLLDEFLILLPILFSLVASWAIFYEIQRSVNGAEESAIGWTGIKNRISYVSLRFRVYILLVLIPITFVIFFKDISPWLTVQSTSFQIGFMAIGTLASLIGFPFLVLLIWRHKAVTPELKSRILETCEQHDLQVFDVRVWTTGGQIVNALVAGFIPRLRFILLSDGLIERFPENELLAVVRHEAGHLRLWHLPIRLVFIVLPLLALLIDEKNSFGMLSFLTTAFNGFGAPKDSALGMISLAYALYLGVSMSWLSKNMEFEADIFSCQDLSHDAEWQINSAYVADMSDALLRLVAENPSQYKKRSLLHPTVEKRLLVLHELRMAPEKASRFRLSFARRRRIAVGLLLAVCILTAAARFI